MQHLQDAESICQVGDRVKKGQTLGIVEAMKLMNEIESDFDGELQRFYVENGQAVEYGQPLFPYRVNREKSGQVLKSNVYVVSGGIRMNILV